MPAKKKLSNAHWYWDTSALLALLFDEPDSKSVKSLLAERKPSLDYTSFFTFIEMESAYHRRLIERSLDPNHLADLKSKAKKLEMALAIVWPDDNILNNSRRYVMEYGLRPGDAIQLASATLIEFECDSIQFLSLDLKLNQAALASGKSIPW